MATKNRLLVGLALLFLIIYFFIKKEKQVNPLSSSQKSNTKSRQIPQLGPALTNKKFKQKIGLLDSLKKRYPNIKIDFKQGFNGTWENIKFDGFDNYKNLKPKEAALKFLSENPELSMGLPEGIVIYANETQITNGQLIVTVQGKYEDSPFPFHKTLFFKRNGKLTGSLVKINNHTPPIRKIDPCNKIDENEAKVLVKNLNSKEISDIKEPVLKIFASSDATGIYGYNISYKWTSELGPQFMEVDLSACDGKIINLPRKATQH